jgi:uncharacterized protein YyaL (SSP411 family)
MLVQLCNPAAAREARSAGGARRLPAPVAAVTTDGGDPRAYACTGTECAAPAIEPETLRETIRTFGRTAAA